MYENSPLFKIYLSNESEYLIFIHAGLKCKKKPHCLKRSPAYFKGMLCVKVLCESTFKFYHRLFYSYVLAILLTSQQNSPLYIYWQFVIIITINHLYKLILLREFFLIWTYISRIYICNCWSRLYPTLKDKSLNSGTNFHYWMKGNTIASSKNK